MTNLAVPNPSFVAGTTIDAALMNANFAAVETMINTTGVPKAQAGAIDGAALASSMSGDRTWTGTNTFAAAPLDGVQSFTASGSISGTGGRLVGFSGSTASQTLTLPAATVGRSFSVFNGGTVTVTVARAGTDVIRNGTGTASIATVGAGLGLTLACIIAGTWVTDIQV